MIVRTMMLGLALIAAAAGPKSVPIDDSGVFPESLSATPDGTLYIGNVAKGVVYRALPGTPAATMWIDGAASGIGRVMGVLADPRRKILWACTFPKAAPGEKVPATIIAYDLATGRERQRYPFDGGGCNDMAIARDGTVYASDFGRGRILRLAKGDGAFRLWAEDPAFTTVDGLAFLADGSLIADTFRTGTLLRIAIGSDGKAGAVTALTASRPLTRPDGMRAIGGNRLVLAEGEGRIDLVTVDGAAATIAPIREGIANGPTSVATARGKAYVSIGNFANRSGPDGATAKSAILVIPFNSAR